MPRQRGYQNLLFLLFILIFNPLNAQFIPSIRKVPFPDLVRPVSVTSMIEDRHNNIWVSGTGYVMRYDGHSFQTYVNNRGLSLSNGLAEDPNTGLILLTSNAGLLKVIGDSLQPYSLPAQITGRRITGILFDKEKRMWLGGKDFLATGTYNQSDLTYRFKIQKTNGAITIFAKNNSSLFVRIDDIIYKAEREKLEKYYEVPKENRTSVPIRLSTTGKSDLLLDNGNILRIRANGKNEWLWKNPQINNFNRLWADESFIIFGNDTLNFLYNDKLVCSLPLDKEDIQIRYSILRTRDGTFWIAYPNGFYCIKLTKGTDITPRLKEDNFYSWSFSNHRLWIGTVSGKLYEAQGGYERLSPVYTDIKKRYPGYLTSLITDVFFSGEKLYLATEYSGLIEYTNAQKPVNRYVLLGRAGKASTLNKIIQTTDKTIYATSSGSILRLKDQNVTAITDTLFSGSNYIFDMQEDLNGVLWINSEKGLFCQKNGIIFKPKGLPEDITVTSIIILKNKRLILTTLHEGLIFYDPVTEKITQRLRRENALLSDRLGIMIKDQSDNLWINSQNGLFIIKYPYNKNDIVYPPFWGKGNDRIWGAIYIDGDSILLGDEERYLKFRTKELLDEAHHYLPELYIVTGKIKNYPGFVNGSKGWVAPELDHNQNSLFFRISTYQKVHEPSPIYEYYLKGAEESFSNKTPSGEISYSGLSAGNYELIIRVANAHTQTSELRLPFKILKPWYQRLYMMVLYVLLITAALYFVINREFRIKARKNREEKQLIESELKAIRAQLNPHFVQNLFATIAESFQAKPFDDAVAGLQRISDFVRQVLYKTEQSTQSLEEELEFTEKYIALEQMTSPGLFTYQIAVDDNVDTFGCLVPTLLLQPFIENSIKHGFINMKAGGVIFIKVAQNENYIEIVIADNGVGFKQSGENKTGYVSKGWIISLKRLKLIARSKSAQADIKVLPQGSYLGGATVRICMPLVLE